MLRFSVWPEKRPGLSFRVIVFPSRSVLNIFACAAGLIDAQTEVMALVTAQRRGRRIGCILLSREDATEAIVAHEATHAALRWREAIRLSLPPCRGWAHRNEERLARVVERITGAIWEKLSE